MSTQTLGRQSEQMAYHRMVGDAGFEPVTSTVGAQKEGEAKSIRGGLCCEIKHFL
jgi:hypothetical protein